MTVLIIGLVLFIGVHLFPSARSLRLGIIKKLGDNGYQGVFALTSAVGLGLIIYGMILSEPHNVWTPPPWGRAIIAPLMLLAMILLAAPNMQTNIKRVTRHPMLWGVFVWAVAHSLVNTEQHTLVLFISFGVFSLISMALITLRDGGSEPEKYPLMNDVKVLAAGAVAFGVFLAAHPYLFGVAVF